MLYKNLKLRKSEDKDEKVGTSTYIQRVDTVERKLLKQVKELDDVMQIVKEIKKKTKKDRYKDEKLT
jgi:hypothetical protein